MHIYGAIASRCIDYEALVDAVAETDWSIEDICTQHSSYVDRVGEVCEKSDLFVIPHITGTQSDRR